MLKLYTLVEMAAELARVLILDTVAELIRKLAGRVCFSRGGLGGMAGIRRHIHRRCRRRLFRRLSTNG